MIAAVAAFLIPSLAATAAVTTYLGNDVAFVGQTIQGDWVGNVGADGYHLLYWGENELQQLYPPYLLEAQPAGFDTWQWDAPGTTDDVRAPENADETQRCAATWYTGGTGYIRIPVVADKTFVLGVYMLDWDDQPRNADVSVCDSFEEGSPPWTHTTGNYVAGQWIFTKVSALAGDTVSVRMDATASNATPVMLSFDAAELAVTQFEVTDQTTGNTFFTDSATVDVILAGGGPAAVVGYQVTDSPVEPTDGWLTEAPATHNIPGEGLATLYGWVKDDGGAVAGAEVTINYLTGAPMISNIATVATGSTLTVTWTTNLDALGWIMYSVDGGWLDAMSATSGPGLSHSVELTELLDETIYDLEIHSNTTTAMHSAATTASEPTAGDVVWAGRADTLGWDRGSNWEGFQQPDNPTSATVTFGTAGSSDAADVVTSVVDPQNTLGFADTWDIGSLSVDVPEAYHMIRPYDDTAAAAKSLAVENTLTVVEGTLAFIDGSLGLAGGAAPVSYTHLTLPTTPYV